MVKELERIDISDVPELLRLAEEVKTSGTPRLLTSGDEAVAVLTPVKPPKPPAKRRKRRDRRTGPDDPLWNIIGIANSAGSPDDPRDVSENKYKYLADAYDLPRT